VDRVSSHYDIEIHGKEYIEALFSMTPYYWRTSEGDKEKLLKIDSLVTDIEFEINVYQKINNNSKRTDKNEIFTLHTDV